MGVGQGELFSVLCAMMWGLGVVLLRRSGESVPPLALNMFKNTVATLLFFLTLPILGLAFFPVEASLQDWGLLLLSGALGLGLADMLFLAALNRVGASRAAVIDCTYSPFVALCALAHPQLQGDFAWPNVLGLALVLVGVLISSRDHSPEASTLKTLPAARRDIALGVASIFLMALGFVIAKPVIDRHATIWANLVRFLGGFIFLLPFAASSKERWQSLRTAFRPSSAWRIMIPTAVLGTYVATILWLAGLKQLDPFRASILNQTSTFFIVLFAVIILRERLTAQRAAGLLCGAIGALIVAYRPQQPT